MKIMQIFFTIYINDHFLIDLSPEAIKTNVSNYQKQSNSTQMWELMNKNRFDLIDIIINN